MTETKRCAQCNKSRHYRCYNGNCVCRCQTHVDNKNNIEPDDFTYSKESEENFEKIMNEWRSR